MNGWKINKKGANNQQASLITCFIKNTRSPLKRPDDTKCSSRTPSRMLCHSRDPASPSAPSVPKRRPRQIS